MTNTATLWGNIFTGQAIAFSLCILMIGKMDRHKALWLMSNLIGSLGLFIVTRDKSLLAGMTGITGAWMVLASGSLKGLALREGKAAYQRNMFSTILIIASLSIGTTGFFVPFDYRLLLIMIAGVFVNLACITALIGARRWRGSWASWLMIISLSVAALGNNMRLITVYPFGQDRTFLGQTDMQFVSIFAVITLSFFMQVAFIGLLHARDDREKLMASRRTIRADARALAFKQAKLETDKLAAERLTMLQLLTHEVRQPLNNAQAALQTIMMQLTAPSARPEVIKDVVHRTERVLDDITLTLSNAITGATLIDRHQAVALEPVEVIGICRLAIMDCSAHDRQRIDFAHPEEDVFAHCDPVLLRLALRNLLDNAVKYSPHSSRVKFTVEFDDEAFGIRFAVYNKLADLNSLQGNIHERGKRGVDRAYDGYGVGLFIVSETARLHFGELSFYQTKPDDVTFVMFLPL